MSKVDENRQEAGRVPGSGRKKGTPNRVTRTLEQKAEELGIDPFETILLFALGDSDALGVEVEIPLEMQFKALEIACTYLYPKRKSIEVTTNVPRISIEEFLINKAEQRRIEREKKNVIEVQANKSKG